MQYFLIGIWIGILSLVALLLFLMYRSRQQRKKPISVEPTTNDSAAVQIAAVNDSPPLQVYSEGGRVEITSPTRWDLNGNGSNIHRGESMRLVTGEPYLGKYFHEMNIPVDHVVIANGNYQWQQADLKVWNDSPIPSHVNGWVTFCLRVPLGVDGSATSIVIKPNHS